MVEKGLEEKIFFDENGKGYSVSELQDEFDKLQGLFYEEEYNEEQCWIYKTDIEDLLSELEKLEANRKGDSVSELQDEFDKLQDLFYEEEYNEEQYLVYKTDIENLLSELEKLEAEIEETQNRMYEIEGETHISASEVQELSNKIETLKKQKEQLGEKYEFKKKLILDNVKEALAGVQKDLDETKNKMEQCVVQMDRLREVSDKWYENASVIERISTPRVQKTRQNLFGFEFDSAYMFVSDLLELDEIKRNEDLYNKLKIYIKKCGNLAISCTGITVDGEFICSYLDGGAELLGSEPREGSMNFKTGRVIVNYRSIRPDWERHADYVDETIIDRRLSGDEEKQTDQTTEDHVFKDTEGIIADRTANSVQTVMDDIAKATKEQKEGPGRA